MSQVLHILHCAEQMIQSGFHKDLIFGELKTDSYLVRYGIIIAKSILYCGAFIFIIDL